MLSLPVCGFDWPVQEKVLIATFGENRDGRFFKGIDIGGGQQQVFAIADGEVIFRHEEGANLFSLKRGNGSFVVLQHEGRIRSVYSHLKKGSIDWSTNRFKSRLDKVDTATFMRSILNELGDEEKRSNTLEAFERVGDSYFLKENLPTEQRIHIRAILADAGLLAPLGLSGDTGISEGTHLSLILLDNEEQTILNPIKKDKPPLSPLLETPDQVGPNIGGIYIRRENEIIELKEDLELTPGDAEVLVEIHDKSDFVTYNRNIAPYRLYLGESGRVVQTVTFNALVAKGRWLVLADSGLSCEDLYQDDWLFRLGTMSLVEGMSHIQIRVEDFLGRESSADIHIGVSAE
jgi:hypothetical protein